jgi:hypothetical protein
VENLKNIFQKPLATGSKCLYNTTMMKTIHSFTQQPQTSLWSAGYRSAKVEINDTHKGLSNDEGWDD